MASDTQERWTIYVCRECGFAGYPGNSEWECANCSSVVDRVEVIPASTATQLAEALERIEALPSTRPTRGWAGEPLKSERMDGVAIVDMGEAREIARTALTHYRGERNDPT